MYLHFGVLVVVVVAVVGLQCLRDPSLEKGVSGIVVLPFG